MATVYNLFLVEKISFVMDTSHCMQKLHRVFAVFVVVNVGKMQPYQFVWKGPRSGLRLVHLYVRQLFNRFLFVLMRYVMLCAHGYSSSTGTCFAGICRILRKHDRWQPRLFERNYYVFFGF